MENFVWRILDITLKYYLKLLVSVIGLIELSFQKRSSTEVTVPLNAGDVGKEMRDVLERESDLRDQLKFAEEDLKRTRLRIQVWIFVAIYWWSTLHGVNNVREGVSWEFFLHITGWKMLYCLLMLSNMSGFGKWKWGTVKKVDTIIQLKKTAHDAFSKVSKLESTLLTTCFVQL